MLKTHGRTPTRNFLLLALSLFTLASSTPSLAGKNQAYIAELALSVPSETDLAVEGIASTKNVWIREINAAKKSISLGHFYATAQKGEALDPVIEALRKAGNRGVKIRYLISNALLKDSTETVKELEKIPGLEIRVFDLSKKTGGIIHSKYWIFDETKILVGSANFDWRALSEIHELSVLTDHPASTQKLSLIFEADWKFAGGKSISENQEEPIEPNQTEDNSVDLVASPAKLNPKGVKEAEKALVSMINSAKKSISIQLLNYEVTEGKERWTVFDDALNKAAARGVKVRVLLSDWSLRGSKYNDAMALGSAHENIEVRIAFIPLSSRGEIPCARVIHSKYMEVDGSLLWIGTSNWGRGYFENSRNVELIFNDSELTRSANQIFAKLWTSKYVKNVKETKKVPPKPKNN